MLKFAILLTALAVCYGQRTKYVLFNQANPRGRHLATGGTLDDARGTTIILIHGHLGRPSDDFNFVIRNETLTHRHQDQIVEVDWEDDASTAYATASRTVTLIAAELATFISELKVQYNSNQVTADVKGLHLVGFGLGAHVAGMASRQLENKVGRITGLNPDGRGWEIHTSGHLRRTDADYVEVIHTDGLGLPRSCAYANGIGTAIGEVNFYVNGGSNQPGCYSHSCSHNRAYKLFAASFANSNLVGYPCSTMTLMNINRCNGDALRFGDTNVDKITGITAASVYRINTRENWPF